MPLCSPSHSHAFSPRAVTPPPRIATGGGNGHANTERKPNKAGGDAYVSPDDHDAHIRGGPGRVYHLYEYGDIVIFLCASPGSKEHLLEALLPQSDGGYKPVFTQVS